ncbi:hypothetical protein QR721_10155 [Aciduricibacillus chroicocephali]|uniref:Uncharacterized protein n=1 Tax=Aciduricibacillus chroicocephali TaxID=3054939 RepID=A0ABY9KT54_9BACI|nr:hypothetical protein QR721_10155 [Bacillaceae bacterium 44XB]
MKEREKIKTLMEKLINETENSRIDTSEELIQALVKGLDFIKGGELQAQPVRK